jgi:dihydropyrimidinase
MGYDLVVRGGTIVTATDNYVGDIGVRAGRIVEIGDALPRAQQEVDARGLQVLPGGIDVHTHLDIELAGMRSADDFESGTAAAACGGVTTICDYAWQEKGWSLAQTLEAWKVRAQDRAHIDYAFHTVINDVDERRLAEIPRLAAEGYPSFKVFMIKEFGISDEALLRVLRAGREANAVINIHAENSEMLDLAAADMLAAGRWDPRYYAESRPALAEAEATRRAIDYAELVDAEIYIVHMSCREAVEAVHRARQRGLRVWGETRPIYLGLTQERYEAGGVEAAKVIGAPPLRTRADKAALWDGLRTGDIQVIGSDNCSWTVEQKAVGAQDFRKVPYGVPGLETEMRVIYSEGVATGRIPVQTFVAAFATNPAKIFGLYPQKGTIAVGSDADLVLFDPRRTETVDERRLHSRAKYDPFQGFKISGVPVLTVARGEIVAREGQLLSQPGRGKHLLRRRAR